MAANENDKDPKDEPAAPVDLEHVHSQQVEELDSEQKGSDDDDTPADDKKGQDDNQDSDDDAGDDDSGDDDDSGSDDDDSGSSDDGDDSDEEQEPDTPPAKPAPTPEAPETPDKPIEINKNPEENAPGKIAVKDSDGKQWYFNNLDEVPDDFEPDTYKNWGKAVEQFARKSISDDRAAEENRIREAQAAQQKEIDDVTNRWDAEQATMLKSGLLPKDAKEREVAVNDTYVYIGQKLREGIVIESFEQAHKARLWDEEQANKGKERQQKGEQRQSKGGKVLPGSSGALPGKKKESTQLPPGTSLDAVHARYAGLN